MNYYDFHIGDYTSRTAHLEPLEDLAYRRLLDLYYVREGALPSDIQEVARLIRLRGMEDLIGVVLAEFFVLTDCGWTNSKCEEVIFAAQEKRSKAQTSAAKRWHSERTANALPTHSEGNAPSPSPSPIKEEKAPRKRDAPPLPVDKPDDVDEQTWGDWLRLRKSKRAPVTATVVDGARAEALKAGMPLQRFFEIWCLRGSQGLQAEWLRSDERRQDARTVPSTPGRDPTLAKLDEDARKAAPIPAVIREKLAALKGGVLQ